MTVEEMDKALVNNQSSELEEFGTLERIPTIGGDFGTLKMGRTSCNLWCTPIFLAIPQSLPITCLEMSMIYTIVHWWIGMLQGRWPRASRHVHRLPYHKFWAPISFPRFFASCTAFAVPFSTTFH